jgi:hypothetical protein
MGWSVFFGLKSTTHSFDQLYILDKSELTLTSISIILLEEYYLFGFGKS